MKSKLLSHASRLIDADITRANRLGGGSLSEIWHLSLADGRSVVVKNGPAPRVEAAMLTAIRATGAAVPRVVASDDAALVLEWLPSGGSLHRAWASLGRQIARLHEAAGERYGWADDYAFDSVLLVNGRTDDWTDFWIDNRLLGPGRPLSGSYLRRLESLARDLPNRLPQNPRPVLLHGDLWGGNVVVAGDQVSGLVDPACYFGDAEVDFAMLSLFDSPPADFFAAYGALEPGWRERQPIYQLWPALVHVRLFGSAYHPMLDRLLAALGV